MPPNFKQFKAARKYGYRSGLEIKIAESLKELKIDYKYECMKIEWEDLAYRTYTPDFVLFNGIIIETKGMFTYVLYLKTVDVNYVKVLSLHMVNGVLDIILDTMTVSYLKNG